LLHGLFHTHPLESGLGTRPTSPLVSSDVEYWHHNHHHHHVVMHCSHRPRQQLLPTRSPRDLRLSCAHLCDGRWSHACWFYRPGRSDWSTVNPKPKIKRSQFFVANKVVRVLLSHSGGQPSWHPVLEVQLGTAAAACRLFFLALPGVVVLSDDAAAGNDNAIGTGLVRKT
jgi:hypothetical protein